MPKFTGTEMAKVHLGRKVQMYPFDIGWQQSSPGSESNVKKLDRQLRPLFLGPRVDCARTFQIIRIRAQIFGFSETTELTAFNFLIRAWTFTILIPPPLVPFCGKETGQLFDKRSLNQSSQVPCLLALSGQIWIDDEVRSEFLHQKLFVLYWAAAILCTFIFNLSRSTAGFTENANLTPSCESVCTEIYAKLPSPTITRRKGKIRSIPGQGFHHVGR